MSISKLIGYASRRGIATHPYPKKPFEVDELYRGRPILDTSICIACGACANACPAETIRVEVDPEKGVKRWSIYYGRCIFCARCQEVCPVKAIELSREYELASKAAEDLKSIAEFRLGVCGNCKEYLEISTRQTLFAQELLENSELAEPAKELKKYTIMCTRCKRMFFAERLAEAARSMR